MTKNTPLVVVNRILDDLWDDLVIDVDTGLYFSLLLVNKTFKEAVYRRRKALMLGQAIYLRTTEGADMLGSLKDPFKNPYNSPFHALAHFVFGFDRLEEDIDGPDVIGRHRQTIDALLPVSETAYLMMTGDGDDDAYAANRGGPVCSSSPHNHMWFFKDVRSVKRVTTWTYGVFWRDAHNHVPPVLSLIDVDLFESFKFSISFYRFPE
ncbi:hypothetical protein DFJ77DRAFT_108037 [Powellomyces hirtus]|nr:hypothetical protein DFJ77DRAFT_108037 [Powellomyces hirtus]